MTGKEKCKLLRKIRRDIAAANDIPHRERECTHTGECMGTCPYCEAELRRLERSLAERRSLGKRIAVVGLSMGLLTANLSSCDNPFARGSQLQGDMIAPPDTTGNEQIELTDHIPGELVEATTTTEPPIIEGMMPVPETLMGDPVLPVPEEPTMGVPPLPETDLPEPDEDAAVVTESDMEPVVLMGKLAAPETDLPEPEQDEDEDAAVTTEPYVDTTVLMGTMPVPETSIAGGIGPDPLLPEPEDEREAVTIAPETTPASPAS